MSIHSVKFHLFSVAPLKLNCYPNKMEIGLELDHLARHSVPYSVKFHGDNNCPTLNGSSSSSIWDGRLWMTSNFTDCGIKVYEKGSKLVFEQTVEVQYGDRMKSSDVYRHFMDTYNATCSIDRNITHKLNIDVKDEETIDDGIGECLIISSDSCLKSFHVIVRISHTPASLLKAFRSAKRGISLLYHKEE